MPLLTCPKGSVEYEYVLDRMSMWNIPLCVVICVLNPIVIAHYSRHATKITSLLFLLISISDLSTALGHLVLGSCVLALRSVPTVLDWTAAGIAMFHALFGLLGYALSIFFNVVLAVVRTVKICNPFYRVNVCVLKLMMMCHVTLLLVLCALDLYYHVSTVHTFHHPWYTIWFNMDLAFVGHNLVYDLDKMWLSHLPFSSQICITATLVSLVFLLPVFVVVLCLITQLSVVQYRRHTQSDHSSDDLPACSYLCCCPFTSNTPTNLSPLNSLTDWSHVNFTVFLLSLIFVLCNSGVAVLTIYYKVVFSNVPNGSVAVCYLQGVISSTLPLLNALLTPIVLIIRGRTLREGVRSLFRRGVDTARSRAGYFSVN